MGPAPLLLLAAALAGVATLAAEMLWIRGLGRGVGTTYEAVAMIAGLFLAGLGVGAWLGARFAPHTERPARGGVWLLAGAGTWIALSPLYVSALPGLRASLFPAESALLPALLLQLPLVVPPALALGALFPYLVRARVEEIAHAGSRAGGVYAANTVGGVVGLLLLLPVLGALGETLALRLAGAAALLGALLLWLADRPLPHGEGPPAPVMPGQTSSASGLGAALFASGAAALLAQLAWLRMLQPLAGAHLYGVVLLLAPLLLALAVGAAVSGPLADRLRRPAGLVPLLLTGAGALLLLSLPTAGGAPLRVLVGTNAGGGRTSALVWAYVLTVAPATLMFGALLPAAVRVRAIWSGNTAGPAGRLYAWNAVGALVGSLLAGYVLLPRFGAERTLFVAAAIVVSAAVVLRWSVPGRGRQVTAVAHALPLLVLVVPGVLSGWLGSGPVTAEVIAARKPLPAGISLASREDMALYGRWFAGRLAARPGDGRGTALPTFEGRGGRIELLEEADGRIGLRRGGLRESVFDPERPNTPGRTEYALGLLPTLMHRAPERALIIGHGAGWTAEAVLAAGAKHVTIAEIDFAVLDAARAVRGLERLPTEVNPNAHIVAADGRVLLRTGPQDAGKARAGKDSGLYELIASQPSHPWHPASGHLFTIDAFREAHDALAADGVHAQWLNLFDMTPALLKRALASYRAVFEHVWVFRFPGELVLLGFRERPVIDVGRWEGFFAPDRAGGEAARAAGLGSPGALLKHWLLDSPALDRVLARDGEVLTDDLPLLELGLARRRLDAAAPADVDTFLLAAFPPDLAANLRDGGVRERWITDAVHAWLADGASEEADRWARKLRWGSTPAGRSAQARAALAVGDAARAETILLAARTTAPDDGKLAAQWIGAATALVGTGTRQDEFRRTEDAKALAARMPRHGTVQAAYARMLRTIGRVAESGEAFENAARATEPEPPDGLRVQYARLLLSQAYGPPEMQRALGLLAADPGTYSQVEALDLLLRLTTLSGDEQRATEIEQSLATLERVRGLALMRTASDLLARMDFVEALDAARACTEVWATESEPFELRGLAALCMMAASATGSTDEMLFRQEALDALLDSTVRSDAAPAAKARAARLLTWFGLEPHLLEVSPDEDAE
jgi:spermidine synthase